MAYQESVQNFVRALRAPTDPPKQGGPSKIDIASAAWHETSFHVPRKAETILEWCLTRLLKDGMRPPASNPVLDLRFWMLMQSILSSLSSKSSKTGFTRNAWLIPLLNRVPLLPIVSSLLSNSLNLPAQKRDEIYLQSSRSLALVWPHAAPKFSLDNLLECFGSTLRVLHEVTTESGENPLAGLIAICKLVTSSLHTAFSHSSNKKKFSQAFMTSHIDRWLNFISSEAAVCSHKCTEIRDLGVELLFNADSLKQIAEGPCTSPLVNTLRTYSTSQPHLLSTLPFLMAAFTDAVKKRRSVLSSVFTTDSHSLAMLFFSSCEEILHGVGDLKENRVWHSRLGLLRVVEDELLFNPRDENEVVLLKEEVGTCIECLASVENENVRIAIQCLCVLSRIDHDLVETFTGPILAKFLTVLQSSHGESLATPAREFLSLALSFHMKTRTLPAHISCLINTSTPPPQHSSSSVRSFYDGLVASPALSLDHLNKLSMAVRTFITPGQTLDTTRRVLDMLQEIWKRFREGEKAAVAEFGQRPRKKRRMSQSFINEDADTNAVTFMLAARIVGTVLTSLPLHTITEAEQARVKSTVVESLASFIREAVLAGTDAMTSGSSNREGDIWAIQVVAAAALRLRYMLRSSGHALDSLDDQDDLNKLVAAVLQVDDCLPEYSIEIFRYLLHHGFHRNAQQQQVILDAALSFLEVYLPAHRLEPKSWSGRSSQLSFDKDGSALAAVALLRLLLDRNVEVINAYASSAQQERFINLLHLADLELGDENAERDLSLVTIVRECLHSANFWEQDNIRSSFFAVQHARTAFMDTIDVAKLRKKKKRASSHCSEGQMREAVETYTFLLYSSVECIPKTSRNVFLKRAVALDFLLGSAPDFSTHRAFKIVRTFLARTFSFLGSWEHETSGQYLRYLMTSPVTISLEQVTTDLVQGHLRSAFRIAVQGSTEVVFDAIQICKTQPLGDWLLSQDTSVPLRGSAQLLMDTAMTDFSLSSFSPDLADHLSSLFEHVLGQLHPIISRLASRDVTERDELLNYSNILLLWSRAIAFGRYLDHPKNPPPGLGAQIMQAISPSLLPRSSNDSNILNFGSAMHAVLVAELHLIDKEESEDRESHLQRIVTTYIVFAHLSMSGEQCSLDENMAELFRTLSPSEFSLCLQFMLEALSSNGIASDGVAHLIGLISLALHNSPENTLRIVQANVKECLDIFVNDAKLSDAHILRLPMLSFISDLCSKRPASIRPQDAMSIWVYLSRLLASSKTHNSETNIAVFHETVGTLGSLVRLRRDLVVTTLPHLSNIIRRLLFIMRSPRPLLGAKQYTIVADSFPVWVNPSHPLGVEESKDLSRLLTLLSTKTLVRVHGPSTELRKPESLARPLSKHVACILQAYFEVLNDPLCVLPADIRRELQPGLFVLCDMLNEHARDALMVSALDASGKAIMKGLWREYEKQRYTGKG